MKKINLSEVKTITGVGFGTSGIRDLIEKLNDKTVYLYTKAFLSIISQNKVAIAGDRRASTKRIMLAVARAIIDSGKEVINCGLIPTPAVTYFGIVNDVPSIMVTGSHIPDDRNGVKFQLSTREILKSDEALITNGEVEFDEELFDNSGFFVNQYQLPGESSEGYDLYCKRYVDFFGDKFLFGKNIGLWGHSAVGRDLYVDLITRLGAKVTKIDYSNDVFVPVDTDAVNEETIEKMKKWDSDYNLDYVISTDGDGDRPLLTDEKGVLVRSELLPIFASKYMMADVLATTVTACSVVEKSGFVKKVVRTPVGSPFIVASMMDLEKEGYKRVTGYELNGGFFLLNDFEVDNKNIGSLPTRDAILPILATIALAIQNKCKVFDLVEALPKRFTYSSSVKDIPTELSLNTLANWENYKNDIVNNFGKIIEVNLLDGLRLTFENEDIVHFRPSKNAPEFRNYTESSSYGNAKTLSNKANDMVLKWTKTDTIGL